MDDPEAEVEAHGRPRRKNANLRPAEILQQQKPVRRRTRSQVVADGEAERSAQAAKQLESEKKRRLIAQVEARLLAGKVWVSLKISMLVHTNYSR